MITIPCVYVKHPQYGVEFFTTAMNLRHGLQIAQRLKSFGLPTWIASFDQVAHQPSPLERQLDTIRHSHI